MSSRDTTSHVAPPRRKTTAQIDVQIGARYAAKVKARLLRQAAQATLEQQRIRTRKELTLVITGNAQLRALNRTFRQIDAPTDVLSFATDEMQRPTTLYLGDVVISYPKAREQARAGGHALEAELQLLVVHGVLHLLGYDHGTAAEQAAMWKAQAAVLKKLGAEITAPKL